MLSSHYLAVSRPFLIIFAVFDRVLDGDARSLLSVKVVITAK